LAKVLFTKDYVLPFEIVSILLLVAIGGSRSIEQEGPEMMKL